MTDEDLVLLLQQGDQGAFRELYEKIQNANTPNGLSDYFQ